jgi:hypothetical protein
MSNTKPSFSRLAEPMTSDLPYFREIRLEESLRIESDLNLFFNLSNPIEQKEILRSILTDWYRKNIITKAFFAQRMGIPPEE